MRTKTLKDGTKIRVYIYTKKGPRGGRTTGERVKKSNGKAK